MAKALDVFHDCEMVHRDCTLDNSCTAGLFDHGTICKAGEFSPLMGANLEFLPQEILQAVSCLIDPSLEAAKLISDILTNRGNTHTELPSADFNLVERTIKHTCAVDIFILGAQFDRILKILYTPDVFIAHNLSFVTAMLHPDPLKRPTIKEIIPILEGYHLVLASKT